MERKHEPPRGRRASKSDEADGDDKRSSPDSEGQLLVIENGKSYIESIGGQLAGGGGFVGGTAGETRVYRRRWLTLVLFVLYSMANAYQWIQYSIINNIVAEYYQVDSFLVNFTSVIYMIVYIPLIFPASWLLNVKGLRFCVLLGSLGTTLGTWIKCASVARDRFHVTMLGQSVVAVSQIFILGIPPKLAAVWFGPKEVSTACSIGVFGNQLGVALGFLIPPVVVQNKPLIIANTTHSAENMDFENFTTVAPPADPEVVSHGLQILFYSCAGMCSMVFLLIVLLFKDRPLLPPSPAAAAALEQEDDYKKSIINLMSNKNYLLLLVSYGINVGVFYGISVLLNEMITMYFPGHEVDGGRIGLLIVISGMLGSVACGFWLDKTHKFKQTTLGVYALSFVGMILYSFIFQFYELALVYVVASFLGFFMTGYLPVGFEFAAELTYPESEGTSSGLLNASAQIFGIIFTFGAEAMLRFVHKDIYANLVLAVALLVGLVLTGFIKTDLRRQRAQQLNVSCPSTPDGK